MVRSHARRSGISSVDDLESESVSTEFLSKTSDSKQYIDVNPDGSQDATSLADAIELVNKLPFSRGQDPTITIRLTGGETYLADELTINAPWVGMLEIADDGTAATIEVPQDAIGFHIWRTNIRLNTDITIQPADPQNPHKRGIESDGSRINLTGNVELTGASFAEIWAGHQSHIDMDSAVTLTGGGTNFSGIAVHSNSYARLNGNINNYDRAVYVQYSQANVEAQIDNCTHGIWVGANGRSKALTSASITNCDNALTASESGSGKVRSSTDLTGTTNKYNYETGGVTGSQGTEHRVGGPLRVKGADLLFDEFQGVRLGDKSRGRIRWDGAANTLETEGDPWRVLDTTNGVTPLEVNEGQGPKSTGVGPDGRGEYQFENARIFEDGNGEVVVEDSSGNTTTIS